jgi:hypothetical protein
MNRKKVFLDNSVAVAQDIALIIFALLSFLFAAENGSGFLFPHTVFMDEHGLLATLKCCATPLQIIALVYVVVAVVCRRSAGMLLCNRQQRRKARLLLAATLTDFGLALSLTLLLDFALQDVVYLEFFVLLFWVMLGYAIAAGFLRGRTAGRYLFGIALQAKDRTSFLRYELIKYGILVALPYALLRLLGITDSYAIFLDTVFFAAVVTIVSVMVFKKTLWSRLAHVSKIVERRSAKARLLNIAALTLFYGGSYALIKHLNNSYQPKDTVLWDIHFPYKFAEHPATKEVQPYADFLQAQAMSPKDYVLRLFQTYDIVILSETYHGESTQWEMISDIVADTTFINNVGHVFTEYGSAMHQNKIDTFLHTVFPNDTVLEQETAVLMDYMSGGFYYFVKNLNLLNATLPERLKVQEHYTDVIDWDYFSTRSRQSITGNRDKAMAQVTIDWYNRQLADGKRHKCLVVANTRHAFGYAGGVDKVKASPYFLHLTQGNQGQYISEAFPAQTATVMQNKHVTSRSLFFPVYRPIHRGVWDKAFALNHHRPVGFDLKASPFGNDLFDFYRVRGAKPTLQYADIFTGIIFNKPYMEQREAYHPYHKYAVETEAQRKGITDTLQIQRRARYFDDKAYFDDDMRWARSISQVNFGGILLFLLVSAATWLMLLLYTTIRLKGLETKKQRKTLV